MNGGPDLALVASLIGDATRANILAALLDGRALTASELAYFAHVSPQTASGHLAKLTDGMLLTMLRQGRNRYYRLATPLVAEMLEGIMSVAAHGPERHRPASKAVDAMRLARTCYDHIAGKIGVGLADNLIERGFLVLTPDAGEVTDDGAAFLADFGVDLAALRAKRRTLCRPCLDWTERRLHIGGTVGAAIARRCFDVGWLTRMRDSRALAITPVGRRGLAEKFGLSFEEGAAPAALRQRA
ncbi:MAG TPA: helix-turn-helix transcriptional regulator [Stellaceae bacterium]|jgi:DNA-binding transcriptional ArsR family regulator|nr:helix-turn-helix transcriptional regulator [Stellaceae bacterium]